MGNVLVLRLAEHKMEVSNWQQLSIGLDNAALEGGELNTRYETIFCWLHRSSQTRRGRYTHNDKRYVQVHIIIGSSSFNNWACHIIYFIINVLFSCQKMNRHTNIWSVFCVDANICRTEQTHAAEWRLKRSGPFWDIQICTNTQQFQHSSH